MKQSLEKTENDIKFIKEVINDPDPEDLTWVYHDKPDQFYKCEIIDDIDESNIGKMVKRHSKNIDKISVGKILTHYKNNKNADDFTDVIRRYKVIKICGNKCKYNDMCKNCKL